ncbi:YutD family protein [Aerococcaceae bacterium NML191292]|nr:YutD family protein [Aerococcaceae bacterium NML191292]MCW6661211.1 YutD family protein [Aerococcaceae bacterium NML201209]MCW6662489.1 YutD family protein [Aerococcaceae bacterium NML190073]MCW6665969.1 YutD family protein [Aerococcaceae bacterium NML190938]MCW6674223.1 YutD family protein [Aerococcaceae bacterium NML171108]MCW6675933.1 YutD family protein [Aerococcaceae bacterium NML180378]MCW6682453.1 YutD family protein [Aerococcaceae bacterium NML160702]
MTHHEPTIAQQIEDILLDMTSSSSLEEKVVHLLDETHIQIREQLYQLVIDYREAFDLEAFEARYQDYFDKFDFIVGDWGFEQLRLRGFYQINQRKVPREQTIDHLDEYLKEYCNFGCKYFVLAKESALVKYNQLRKVLGKAEVTPLVVSTVERRVTTKEANFKPSKRNTKKEQPKAKKQPRFVETNERKMEQKPFKQKKRQSEALKAEKPVSSQPTNKKGKFVIKQKMK